MEPVGGITPSEAELMAALARRALVATVDGGPPVQACDEPAGFSVELASDSDEVLLVLHLRGAKATLALAPEPEASHRWRSRWQLEVRREGTGEHWLLDPGDEAVTIPDPRRGRLVCHLRSRRLALRRDLDQTSQTIPLEDVAFGRSSRQSSARPPAPAPLRPWASPTEPEPHPWWELDLDRTLFIAFVRIDLGELPAGSEVELRCSGIRRPDGSDAPAPTCASPEVHREGERAWVEWEPGVVARHVRVSLQPPAGTQVSLAVNGAEVLAAELDGADLADTLRRAFALHRDRALFVDPMRPDDGESALTYAAVWRGACQLSGFLARQLEKRPRPRPVFSAVCRNRPEWFMGYLAALERGYLFAPLAPAPTDTLEHALADLDPDIVLCDRAQADQVARCAPKALLIVCDSAERARRRVGFSALPRSRGRIPAPARPAEDAPFLVLFTSGSTGRPKGAVRSFAQVHLEITSEGIGSPPRHLSFQPLAHLTECFPTYLVHGGTIAFSRGGQHVLEEIRAFEPSLLGAPPRLFELVRARALRRVHELLAHRPQAPREEAEAIALREARDSFGRRLAAVSVGSAPVSPELLGFLRRCFSDLWVGESYGSTEAGTIAVDGQPPSGVDVKLVPIAGALPPAPDAPERGEVFVRSPHAILGYWEGPSRRVSSAADPDGYVPTGDLGERGADGRIRVIGRLGATVKLSRGEFVCPDRIEAALAGATLVDRVFVVAEAGAASVEAVVIPEPDGLRCLLGSEGDLPLSVLVADPRASAAVLAELARHGAAAGLAPYEVPARVILESTQWTAENELLTSSGKLARQALRSRYAQRLAMPPSTAEPTRTALPAAPDPTLARVLSVASRVLGRPVCSNDSIFQACDSLALAELHAALCAEFGQDLPMAWQAGGTFGAFAARLDPFSKEPPRAASALADASLPVPRSRLPKPRQGGAILLTGATGFLGAHLLEALRADGRHAVVALVRAKDEASASARLAHALETWNIPPAAGRDVVVLPGDLAEPHLGLPPACRKALDSVGEVLHAGALVNWVLPYPAMRAPNVVGTLNLLELAADHGWRFHHVSTLSTAPLQGDEDSLLPFEALAESTAYAQSKWVAESLVRRAGATGLETSVYRPGMISGDSRRGVGNPDDFVHRYLSGCAELGCYLDLPDLLFEMTPVDFVARAIVSLLSQPPGQTFHLTNLRQSMTYAALGRALVASGLRLAAVGASDFRARVARAPKSRLAPLAAFLHPAPGVPPGAWPSQRTSTLLARLGVACPEVDAAAVERSVRFLESRGLLPRRSS
ncbi:MAG: thioester reductase domain-containing protein [Myxococcales bacterium]